MAEPFIGQIIPVGFGFAPPGWLPCNGGMVGIQDYPALFQLIGTTYGGDGQNTFGLPDLSGAVAVGFGTGSSGTSYPLGQAGGTEGVTLNANQVPPHSHPLLASDAAGTANVPGSGLVPSGSGVGSIPYSTDAPSVAMSSQALQPSNGGGQAHENRQPLLCISYIIAVDGIYPVQG